MSETLPYHANYSCPVWEMELLSLYAWLLGLVRYCLAWGELFHVHVCPHLWKPHIEAYTKAMTFLIQQPLSLSSLSTGALNLEPWAQQARAVPFRPHLSSYIKILKVSFIECYTSYSSSIAWVYFYWLGVFYFVLFASFGDKDLFCSSG